jgi:hypothetical protein
MQYDKCSSCDESLNVSEDDVLQQIQILFWIPPTVLRFSNTTFPTQMQARQKQPVSITNQHRDWVIWGSIQIDFHPNNMNREERLSSGRSMQERKKALPKDKIIISQHSSILDL